MAAAAGWGAEERGHGRCAPQGECWSGHGRGCWQWRLVGFAQGLRVIVRCFEGSSLRVAASSSCSSKEHARTCMLEGAVLVGAGKAGHSAVLLLLSAEALRSRVRSSCESCSASRFLSASDGTPPRAIRAAQAIEARGSAGCRFTRSGSSAFRALPRTSTSTTETQAERSIDPGGADGKYGRSGGGRCPRQPWLTVRNTRASR